MTKNHKKKSKRIGTKLRENNKKRVANSHRKERKAAKQARKAGLITHKAKTATKIPNLFPGKKELLLEIEAKKVQKEKERIANKETQRREAKALAKMSKNAGKRSNQFEKKSEKVQIQEKMDAKSKDAENSRKSFFKKLRAVITEADVVIQVLDARDPNSCRCPELEREIMSQGKKVILLLNKIDLIPKEAVTAWLTYLRKFHATVAFKAAREKGHMSHAKATAENSSEGLLRSANNVIGADTLMQLLKNYARNGDKKTAIAVGIVGYPNVGKSSVINSMKRSNATKVGASAGMTRHIQEVQLDSMVKLLDSPGIVFAGESEDPSVVMRNATKIETLKDPASVVGALLTRAPKQAMMKHFQLPEYRDATDFLVQIAKSRGKLKRGGTYDLPASAKHVLADWATGKIRYYSMPPKEVTDAKIVTEFAPEFDLSKAEEEDLNTLETETHTDAMCMEASEVRTLEMDEAMSGDDSESEEEEEEEEEQMAEEPSQMLFEEKVVKKQRKEVATKKEKKMFNSNNPQINKVKKKSLKTTAKVTKKKSSKADDFDFSVLKAGAMQE